MYIMFNRKCCKIRSIYPRTSKRRANLPCGFCMMFRSPRPAQLPHLQSLLDNIPASEHEIARLLDVTVPTLRKYKAKGQAPRTVMLALFWESTWGRQTADVTAANHAAQYFALAQALKRENQKLVNQLLTLERELMQSNAGAANSPIFRLPQTRN